MRLKLLISLLLLLQALIFAHMLILIDWSPSGAAISVEAKPGAVTQVDIYPYNPWGGAWGRLEPDGATEATISSGDIAETHIKYDDEDNNCSRTELIAGLGTIDPTTVGPVDPVYADGILGFDSRSPYSVQAMFDTLRTFELGANSIELWSLETQGKLGPYIQGVGLSGSNIVFVTQTKRNAQNYAGEPANYQFILPAGNWQITYDESDACTVLNETLVPEPREEVPRLDLAVPERFCTNTENLFYSVQVTQRTFCRPSEVGSWYCQGKESQITISRQNVELSTVSTDSSGLASFSPAENGQYVIKADDGNQTVSRLVTSEVCLDRELVGEQQSTIQYPAANLQAPEETYPGRYGPSPGAIEEQLKKDFILIAWITVVVIILSCLAFWKQHKDDSILLLKLRIWWKELRS